MPTLSPPSNHPESTGARPQQFLQGTQVPFSGKQSLKAKIQTLGVLTAVVILMLLVIGKMCICVCVYSHVYIYIYTHTYGLPLGASLVVQMVKSLSTMQDLQV